MLNAGFVYDACNQYARGVGEKMPFASLDFFARVEPAWPSGLGGFDRLTIDHPRCGRRLTPFGLAGQHDQVVIDLLPRTVISPPVEIALDRRVWRKSLSEEAAIGIRFA